METLLELEECLLPSPEIATWNEGQLTIVEYTTMEKVAYYALNVIKFVGLLIAAPFTLTYEYFTQKDVQPIQVNKPDISPPIQWPPAARGYATSLFQTAGLGTKWSAVAGLEGKCDWDKWMDKPGHIIAPEGFDYREFFTDVLTDPTSYIQMLREQNVTAHRFSLEWSVFQPTMDGPVDPKAVALYRNFIDKLIEAGITPYVTLSHFVMPEWFHEAGGFQNMENIDRYVNFALEAMRQFPQVKDWWSFNELNVLGFQKTREVYPTDVPEGSSLPARVHAAGVLTRNMIIAHCRLHQAVVEQFPENKVGVTHQWLQFDTAANNWLENLMVYIFTKFGFSPVYQFFKDGKFSFKFPFMANIEFRIPKEEFEANGHFLQRIGVQAYPKPMLKMGPNHGDTYPGLPSAINNLPLFSFGATCEPGGAVMRFGPRCRPDGVVSFLEEAFALTDEVFLSEWGGDANMHEWGKPGFAINQERRAEYTQQLAEQVHAYMQRTGNQVKGLFCWSDLETQCEWENGKECRLGQIEQELDEKRQIVGWKLSPAATYLRDLYAQGEPAIVADEAG